MKNLLNKTGKLVVKGLVNTNSAVLGTAYFVSDSISRGIANTERVIDNKLTGKKAKTNKARVTKNNATRKAIATKYNFVSSVVVMKTEEVKESTKKVARSVKNKIPRVTLTNRETGELIVNS